MQRNKTTYLIPLMCEFKDNFKRKKSAHRRCFNLCPDCLCCSLTGCFRCGCICGVFCPWCFLARIHTFMKIVLTRSIQSLPFEPFGLGYLWQLRGLHSPLGRHFQCTYSWLVARSIYHKKAGFVLLPVRHSEAQKLETELTF